MFWKFIQYTIHWDKTQMLKIFPSDKINITKMHFFSFLSSKLITVLLLICNSYTDWSFHLSKTLCGIFHFRFLFVFIKLYIFFHQKARTLTLKRHNSFHHKSNGKATHSFVPRLLIFKLQQEVQNSMISAWFGAPKNWPGDKLFKLSKQKFWVCHFF